MICSFYGNSLSMLSLLMLIQEILSPISNNALPFQRQSPEASSTNKYDYIQENGAARSLNGKLAAGVNLNNSSTEHGQSVEPLVSSNVRDEGIKETMKSLNEKLSTALLTIRAKEDLVKQHAKVTEEAVAGNFWSF